MKVTVKKKKDTLHLKMEWIPIHIKIPIAEAIQSAESHNKRTVLHFT